jgi:hypothetical protein
MRRFASLFLAGLLAGSFCIAAHAQWKWRDTGGQLHISDLPPPADVPEKDVLQRPTSALRRAAPAPAPAGSINSSAAPAKAGTDSELESRMRRTEQDRQAQQKKEEEKLAAARAENCSRAKEYMRTLDSGMRISRVNDKGEREVIDDKQRAEETQRTRAAMDDNCR